MFDVVELKNGNNATILTMDSSKIKIEEVNKKGISLGVKEITDSDIKEIIFRK